MKYDIIILALNRSDDILNSTTWQMANAMAQTKRVLYINHPKTWLDCLKSGRWIRSKVDAETANLHCMESAPVLPINFLPKGKLYDFMQKLNHAILLRSVRNRIGKQAINLFINAFDFYFPYFHRMLGTQVSKVAYYSLDPIVKKRSKKHGVDHEQKLVNDADYVFCSAKSLCDQWRSTHSNVHYLPNAVNFNSLQRQFLHPPRTISMIKGIKVGLFGNIDRRVDIELLKTTFKGHSDLSLIISGPIDRKSESLLQLPNVHYYGIYKHQNLRSLVESVDVCLIPYRVTPDMQKIYPLKLMEYFTFGKPVVMTPFNTEQVNQLNELIYVVNSPADMYEAIVAADRDHSAHLSNERKRIAERNNWESRTRQLFDIVYHDQSA